MQRRKPEHRLYCRSGRVASGKRTIEQRIVGIRAERNEFRAAQARRKRIRVERRRADQRQQIAVARIDRDRRAAHILHSLPAGELQPHVERQHEVPARCRPPRLQPSLAAGAVNRGRVEQNAALGVDFLLCVPHLTVQNAFVTALDTRLADLRRSGILAAFDQLEVGSADAAHVAHGMCARIGERVVANESFLDVDSGKSMPAHGKPCGLRLAQVAKRDALEGTP